MTCLKLVWNQPRAGFKLVQGLEPEAKNKGLILDSFLTQYWSRNLTQVLATRTQTWTQPFNNCVDLDSSPLKPDFPNWYSVVTQPTQIAKEEKNFNINVIRFKPHNKWNIKW